MPVLKSPASVAPAASVLNFILLCLWIATPLQFAQQTNPPPADISELQQCLANHLAEPRFAHARWGVCIVSLETGATLFSHDEHKLFIPASNAKLYTAALALDKFGGDYRIKTSLCSSSLPNERRILEGDLIVYGRGDPSFAAQWHSNDLDAAFVPFADILTRLKIVGIRGDIVADERFFAGPRFGSGWEWDDLQCYYGAEVSALSVNDNAVEVVAQPAHKPGFPLAVTIRPPMPFMTIDNCSATSEPGQTPNLRITRPLMSNTIRVEGSLPTDHTGRVERISVNRPALWFGECVRKALEKRGVRVKGRVRVLDDQTRRRSKVDPGSLYELGFVSSPPMRELVRRMMKPSQNLHAQLLLLQAGAADGSPAGAAGGPQGGKPASLQSCSHLGRAAPQLRENTETAGLKALEKFLGKLGIPTREVHLVEGSGLSRHNLVTPAATVALLRHMCEHAAAEDFRASLPIAGVDGTLRNRLIGTPAASNVAAKTGSLSGVASLSGYATSAAGERLAFSLMLNNYHPQASDRSARAELDEIVALLARLPFRTSLNSVSRAAEQ